MMNAKDTCSILVRLLVASTLLMGGGRGVPAAEVIDEFEGRQTPGKQWEVFGSLKPNLALSLSEEQS